MRDACDGRRGNRGEPAKAEVLEDVRVPAVKGLSEDLYRLLHGSYVGILRLRRSIESADVGVRTSATLLSRESFSGDPKTAEQAAASERARCMSADPVDPQSSTRSAEEQPHSDAGRQARLVEIIEWLDALPNTSISDVITAQRSRLTRELRQFALRLAESSSAAAGSAEREQHLLVELARTDANIRRVEVFIAQQMGIVSRASSGPVTLSASLLNTFEHSFKLLLGHRELLKRELAASSKPAPLDDFHARLQRAYANRRAQRAEGNPARA